MANIGDKYIIEVSGPQVAELLDAMKEDGET